MMTTAATTEAATATAATTEAATAATRRREVPMSLHANSAQRQTLCSATSTLLITAPQNAGMASATAQTPATALTNNRLRKPTLYHYYRTRSQPFSASADNRRKAATITRSRAKYNVKCKVHYAVRNVTLINSKKNIRQNTGEFSESRYPHNQYYDNDKSNAAQAQAQTTYERQTLPSARSMLLHTT